MTNHQISNDGTLRDSNGREIGEADYGGHISSGGSDKGYINNDDRYIDQYGRDLGWVTKGSDNSNSSVVGNLAGGLLVSIGYVGFQLLSDAKKNAHTKVLLSVPASIGFDYFYDLCLEAVLTISYNSIKEKIDF